MILLFSGNAFAQAVIAMKILSTSTGWVQRDLYHLYWTSDNGVHWKDITPPKSSGEFVTGVFFLDDSSGWVVLAHADNQERLQFRVASTAKAGTNWSVSSIRFPWKRQADDVSGGASVFFIDHLHGWMMVDHKSSSAFALANLLLSQDGGKTWESPPAESGQAGYLCFFNQREGLLAGGAANSELWVTHDGARTWRQRSLKAPPVIAPAETPTHGRPQCGPAQTGFLPVTFSGPNGTHSALVLFATNDAGRTWTPHGVLGQLEETSPGEMVLSAVVGSSMLAATKSKGTVTLTTVGPGKDLKQVVLSGFKEVPDLSFTDMFRGWASTHDGLFSTEDGGNSWTEITPMKNVVHGTDLGETLNSRSISRLLH